MAFAKNNNSYIEIVNLNKSFFVGGQEVKVLKNISIDIKKGDFAIIFGPSGCGKSTLLHTILGLERPSSGQVLIEGEDFYEKNQDERAMYRRHNVGMIYQQPLWISSLDVYNNLVFSLHLLNYPKEVLEEKAKAVLEIVGMKEKMYYRPVELSSGQQQKVSLARALIIEPKIIIADEPTGNLDTVSGQELIDTFLRINEKGITIIMVTHDLEYLKYASHIFHMIDGSIVEDYRPKWRFKGFIKGKRGIEDVKKTTDVRDPKFLQKIEI